MEFEHKSGIYMCTCNINGKSYIGQSSDVKLRKCHHRRYFKSNTYSLTQQTLLKTLKPKLLMHIN